ncbi:MAG: RNase adapter RapZ [Gammaproteobacteria bacterium]|nr:RNase adapter RapZ [Gammaproteobacteria bacterium]
MKLVIVSGRSGSGKSTALNALEDGGFYCIDNLPARLLPTLCRPTMDAGGRSGQGIAVSIDARNDPTDLAGFPSLLEQARTSVANSLVVYLDARSPTLVHRFSETRRRHPLTDRATDLRAAIDMERELLADIAALADLTIDTTNLARERLVDMVRHRIVERSSAGGMSLLFRSFAYKSGVPVDADFVFDVRCLPNPHWIDELKPLTGRDGAVQEYLARQPNVDDLFEHIRAFLSDWLPRFEETHRAYMTVAIGCTGGRHRSVYMAERLAQHFDAARTADVLIRHRDLPRP